MKRFARILTGVIILIFCSSTPAKSLDWKELENMSQEEIADKIEKVPEVVDEILFTIALDEKISARKQLSKKEEKTFLCLALKYKLPLTSQLQAIIAKRKRSKEDRNFLFSQLGLIVGHQKAAIKDHLNVLYCINTIMRAPSDSDTIMRAPSDSDNDAILRNCRDNDKKIKEYEDFVAPLVAYEKRLLRHR